jgi:hypothetical protein
VCRELVAGRREVLGDRVPTGWPLVTSVDLLLEKVAALPISPDAIEAVWEGNAIGWLVVLIAVTRFPPAEIILKVLERGGPTRRFDGDEPRWPVAEEAAQLGSAVAGQLGVPFYFASPLTPDDESPRWWDS